MATDGFEQSELTVPLDKLTQAGATVHVATLDGQAVKGWDSKDWGRTVEADLKISDASADDYIALVLTGGQMNPDVLRADDTAVQKVKDFVAAVCHAPWLFIEAGVIRGREAASYRAIRTDMINAGANWRVAEVAIDNGIITSRSPGDLNAFVANIIEEVREGEHQRKVA